MSYKGIPDKRVRELRKFGVVMYEMFHGIILEQLYKEIKHSHSKRGWIHLNTEEYFTEIVNSTSFKEKRENETIVIIYEMTQILKKELERKYEVIRKYSNLYIRIQKVSLRVNYERVLINNDIGTIRILATFGLALAVTILPFIIIAMTLLYGDINITLDYFKNQSKVPLSIIIPMWIVATIINIRKISWFIRELSRNTIVSDDSHDNRGI